MNPFRVDPRGDEAAAIAARLFDDVWPLAHRRSVRTAAGGLAWGSFLAWWSIPFGAWLTSMLSSPELGQAASDVGPASAATSAMPVLLKAALIGPLLVTVIAVGVLHLRAVRLRETRRAKLVHDARTNQEPPFEPIRALIATAERRRGGGLYGLALHATFVLCVPIVLVGDLGLAALVAVLVIVGLCLFHLLCSKVVVPGAARWWAVVMVVLMGPMLAVLLTILRAEGHGVVVATATLGLVGVPLMARMLLPGLLEREDRRLESVRARMPVHLPGLVSPLVPTPERTPEHAALHRAASAPAPT